MNNQQNSACQNNAVQNVSAASTTLLNSEQNKVIDAEALQAAKRQAIIRDRLAQMRHQQPIIIAAERPEFCAEVWR